MFPNLLAKYGFLTPREWDMYRNAKILRAKVKQICLKRREQLRIQKSRATESPGEQSEDFLTILVQSEYY